MLRASILYVVWPFLAALLFDHLESGLELLGVKIFLDLRKGKERKV